MTMIPPAGYRVCTLKGYVVDQENSPQEGIDIEWDPFGVGLFVTITKTDANGNYLNTDS